VTSIYDLGPNSQVLRDFALTRKLVHLFFQKSESSNSQICYHLSTLAMDGSDWLQNFGTFTSPPSIHFQKVKGHAPYLDPTTVGPSRPYSTNEICSFPTRSSRCLDVNFDDLDLLLAVDLMATVAPPPELALSPNLEEFKHFKGFTFELTPANPDVLGSRRCFPS
jgi:hypothetical protein